MILPSDLTADLPAPRDDEPASLRDDIADELRDHLECAVRREQLRAGEPVSNTEPRGLSPWPDANGVSTAYQRVLAKFGNPRAVARKLWFDAMREKIMGQRISITLQAIMAGAVIAMCVIVYQSIQQNVHTQGMLVAMLNKTQQELLQSQREANAQLIERLAALAKESEAGNGSPSEWNPLSVKVLLDTPDGKDRPPAAEIFLTLSSNSHNTAGIPTIERKTDESGVADFGKVLYGTYELYCSAPNQMRRTELVSVEPGKPRQVTVICPQGDALTAVTPRIEPQSTDAPPPELADRLWYLVSLTRKSSDREWSRSPQSSGRGENQLLWVISPQGQLLDASKLHWPQLSVNDEGGGDAVPRSSLPPDPLNAFVWKEMTLLSEIGTTPIQAEPGDYIVLDVEACLLSRDEQNARHRLLFLQDPIRSDRTPPRAIWTGRSSRTPSPDRDPKPAFSVLYKQDGPVTIPLGEMDFHRFQHVLAAAPDRIAWRFAGSGMGQVMVANYSNQQFALFDILGLIPATGSRVLSGVEVIEWAAGHRRQADAKGWGESLPSVTAIVLVTPAERDALSTAKRNLAISLTPDDPGRSELTPEIIEALQSPEPPPLPTY